MASKFSLVTRRANSLNRLQELKEKVSGVTGVQFNEHKRQVRAIDAEHSFVFQLEAFVEDFEVIVAHLVGDEPSPVKEQTSNVEEGEGEDGDPVGATEPRDSGVLDAGEGATAGDAVGVLEGAASAANEQAPEEVKKPARKPRVKKQ